jgi:hypothetical protein
VTGHAEALRRRTKWACYHRAVTPSGRAARRVLVSCALVLSAAAALHARSGPLPSFDDLLVELASRIAAALPPNEPVRFTSVDAALERHFGALLVKRGVRVVADGAVRLSATCTDTLSARLCAATLRTGDEVRVMSVERVRDTRPDVRHTPSLVLQLRPLVVQQTPILDAAVVDRGLLVLDPTSVSRWERAGIGWRVQDARPIVSSRPWPRDIRGRLVSDAAGFTAFLPGTTCRGTALPLSIACVDEQRAWPLGIDNAGMAAARNYFSSPDGETYYNVAALGPDAGARWLLAAQDGRLLMLDEALHSLYALPERGDDVAGIATGCATGSHVLLPSGSAPVEVDALQLFVLSDRRLVPATPPVALPGVVTAMWPASDPGSATVVARSAAAARYEAFQVSVSCGQ